MAQSVASLHGLLLLLVLALNESAGSGAGGATARARGPDFVDVMIASKGRLLPPALPGAGPESDHADDC